MKKPNKGHIHEVMHVLFLMQNNIQDYVLGNDLFTERKKMEVVKSKVEEALDALSDAYRLTAIVDLKTPKKKSKGK